MSQVAPYITRDQHYLICHNKTTTYLVDLEQHQVRVSIQGLPVSIAQDERTLVIQQDPRAGSFETLVFLDIPTTALKQRDHIDPTQFYGYRRTYFKTFAPHDTTTTGRKRQRGVFFGDIFDSEITNFVDLKTDDTHGVSETISSTQGLFSLLHSPIKAFCGAWSSDWGGYDFFTVFDQDKQEVIADASMMDGSPFQMNATEGNPEIILTYGDGVAIVHGVDEIEKVIPPKPFDSRSMWIDKPTHIDAALFPQKHHCFLLGSRGNWSIWKKQENESWDVSEQHNINGDLQRVAISPDGETAVILTTTDVQLFKINDGQQVARIPLTT